MVDVGGNCSPLRTGRQTAQQHCRRQYHCSQSQHEGQPEEMAEHAIVDALDGRNEMSGMVVAINAFDGCFLGNVMVSVQRRRKYRRHENSQQQ